MDGYITRGGDPAINVSEGIGLQLEYFKKNLRTNFAREKQLKEIDEEYDALITTLQKLPNKRRHKTLVPFGKLAFMDGYITRGGDPAINVSEGIGLQLEYFKKNLRTNFAREKQLKEIDEEYDALITTLQKLPNKRRHKTLVPFGKLAFMDGYITRTNEVTVALGENYFTKCSTNHALGIAERRKKVIADEVDSIKADFKLVKEQLGMAAEVLDVHDGEDIIEITERDEDDIVDLKLPTRNSNKKPIIEIISTQPTTEEHDHNLDILKRFEQMEMDGIEPSSDDEDLETPRNNDFEIIEPEELFNMNDTNEIPISNLKTPNLPKPSQIKVIERNEESNETPNIGSGVSLLKVVERESSDDIESFPTTATGLKIVENESSENMLVRLNHLTRNQ
eukprot:TRINITY_DN297_c0_g2_i1.p1 TRINITY_DN297_c0_g2~~TRINITY_DN297_c0_g2_i1.p1  ORF type:complete len:393 (-),score=102.73 TRINITY_DN297_c0_g2_i1:27-1205(-)